MEDTSLAIRLAAQRQQAMAPDPMRANCLRHTIRNRLGV
jgi:hypothetical protein